MKLFISFIVSSLIFVVSVCCYAQNWVTVYSSQRGSWSVDIDSCYYDGNNKNIAYGLVKVVDNYTNESIQIKGLKKQAYMIEFDAFDKANHTLTVKWFQGYNEDGTTGEKISGMVKNRPINPGSIHEEVFNTVFRYAK